MTDRIFIRDLRVTCIIGTRPAERVQPQEVVLNLGLDCSLAAAAASDDLRDALNYKTLTDSIAGMVEQSSFMLIECMAEAVVSICLDQPAVEAVTVTVDKPAALPQARSVAVEMRRTRKEHRPD